VHYNVNIRAREDHDDREVVARLGRDSIHRRVRCVA